MLTKALKIPKIVMCYDSYNVLIIIDNNNNKSIICGDLYFENI